VELLRDMALFVEVARKRSFSRAAEALGMATSSLSRRISELERRIGLRLLNRTTRRIELTPAGTLYYERSRRIVDEARIAHEQLAAEGEDPRGTLRVTMPADFGLAFLAPLLDEFARRYPGISFDFDLSPGTVDLVSGSVDVAIRTGALPDTGLIARRIANVSRHLYAAPAYLAKAGEPAGPSDLTRHECVHIASPGRAATWTLIRGKKKVEVTVGGRFACNNVGMIRELAALGLGIAMLPERIVRSEVAAGRLRRVLRDWGIPPHPVSALTATRLLPARTRVFLDFLAAKLAE
jgi:DNA-binding transcriptional LysR family regulator